MPEAPPPQPELRQGTLYLRLAGEGPLLQRVKDLFLLFPGGSRTVLYLADSQRRLGATCLLHEALLEELGELLGEENVVVKGAAS